MADFSSISQFSSANDEAFVWADPEQLTGVSVAMEQKLIDDLAAKGGQVSIDPDSMSILLERAAPDVDAELGITLVSADSANPVSADGAAFLAENPAELGYSASWGIETDDGEFLEIFVVIDPDRYDAREEGMSEEGVQAQLDLNLSLITQMLLVGEMGEFEVNGEEDGTRIAQDAETRAEDILNTLLDDVASPPIVIADPAAFAGDEDAAQEED